MKITIIGAGFGGLVAAALMAKEGHEVLVVEKNDQPGGRARLESNKGFDFDMGPSWLLMPEVYEQVMREIGAPKIDMLPLNPRFKIFFENDELIVDDNIIETFEKIEAGAGDKLKQYLKRAEYQYNTAMKYFIYKDASKISNYLNPKLGLEAIKLGLFGNLDAYVAKQFKDHRLRKILEYSMVFLGGSPKNTPSMYSLMSHTDLNQGVFYPKGGFSAVAKHIEKQAKKNGVKFLYNEPVVKINCKNGKVTSIKTKFNTYETDICISNADYPHTELELLDNSQSYDKKYWEKKVIAPGGFILHLGVNKKLRLKHHNLFLFDDWEKHFNDIFAKPKWPTAPNFYVCCPSKTDKVAPSGSENLFVLVPCAPDLDDNQENRKKMKEIVLNIMESKIGKFRENIVYERTFAHKDFKNYFNAYKGTALGLTHTLMQTAIFRPKQKSRKLSNLYYTGQFTNPGTGVPMVMISSLILRDMINKD